MNTTTETNRLANRQHPEYQRTMETLKTAKSGRSKVKCVICKKKFKKVASLRLHVIRSHGGFNNLKKRQVAAVAPKNSAPVDDPRFPLCQQIVGEYAMRNGTAINWKQVFTDHPEWKPILSPTLKARKRLEWQMRKWRRNGLLGASDQKMPPWKLEGLSELAYFRRECERLRAELSKPKEKLWVPNFCPDCGGDLEKVIYARNFKPKGHS
jgi:hypothetical protein